MVRCKNAAGSSQPPPEPGDIAIFENEAAEERYLQIQSKQLLQEKGFIFSTRERFGLPQEEFYAHFTDPNQGTVYVRSERVEFTAQAINKFFAVKRIADLHTPFVKSMKDQNIDFLLENLCFQGAEWDEANTTVERDRLKPAAKLWMHFLKINLMPTTYTAIRKARHQPTQIPSLMGFDEDATAKAPPRGARTIVAARLAKLMALTEKTHEQMQDMQEKMTSLFHYMRERDEAIQSYFLELLLDEVPLFPLFPTELFHSARSTKQRAPQEQTTPQPPPAKKNVASTSTTTPQTRPPVPKKQADPAIPNGHTPTSTPRPSAKNTTATRRTLTRKDKGKAPAKPTPAPEATIELDSDDDNDEDMPDRKANRNISTANLAAEENAASDAEEDSGSSTTLEETPMTNPPQSKARYKRVASKPTPKYAVTRTEKEEMLQHFRKDGEHIDTAALVH
ncbi:hypothetical protein V6N12_062499 [Hibiscus sabdariffa]|uniref:Putative plant transposon protein domain-containing protein n=1 Tax=Hibiscus sabdariffa TaxID=183260 RepID=A0ABR2F920_9ROSI